MRRRLAFLIALVAAIAAGVATASAITAQMSPDAAVGPVDVRPDGSGARVPVTAADPDGRPSFAVRVYRSAGGLTCPEVGRMKDGAFGRVDAGGEFRAEGADPGGSCADLGAEPVGFAINHYPSRDGTAPARAVVFGVVTDEVVSIAVSGRKVRIAGGAFLAVVRDDTLDGTTLDVTLADGTTKSYPLQASHAPASIPADALEESSTQ
jgi:hypothetical protein